MPDNLEVICEGGLRCKECGFIFEDTKEGRAKHRRYCKGTPYHCDECGLDFGRSEEEKKRHDEYHEKWELSHIAHKDTESTLKSKKKEKKVK